jgi:hypothetical protein
MVPLAAGIYALIGWHLPVMAQNGSWTSQQYFDQRTQAWWVQVSSTIPRSFFLTVNWHGYRGNGRVKGSFLLIKLPSSLFTLAASAFGLTRVYSFRYDSGLTLKPSSSYARQQTTPFCC